MATEADNQEPTTETILHKTLSVAEPVKLLETVIKHYEAENVKEPIEGDNIFKSPSVGKVSSEKFQSSSSELSAAVEICDKEVSDNLDGKETEDQVSESLGVKETEGQLPKSSDGKETENHHVEKSELDSSQEIQLITEEIVGEGYRGHNGGTVQEAEVYESELKEENKVENLSNASIMLDNTEKIATIEPVTFDDHISITSPEEGACHTISSGTAKKELHMASASEDLRSNLEEMEPKGDMKEEITNNEKIDCDAAVNVSLKSDNLSEPNKEEAEKGEEMNASPAIALAVKPIDETCVTGFTSEQVSSSGIKEIASLDGQSEKDEKTINIEINLPEAPREAGKDESIDANSTKEKQLFDEKNVAPVERNKQDVIYQNDTVKGQQDAPSLVPETEISEGTQLPVEEPMVMHNIDESDRKLDIYNLGLPQTEGPSDGDMALPSLIDGENIETESRLIANDLNEEVQIHMYDTAKGQQDDPSLAHEVEATGGTQLHVEEPKMTHNIDEVERNLDSSHLVLPPTEGAPDMALALPCQIDADNLEPESRLIAHDLNEKDEIQLCGTPKGPQDAPPLETKTDNQEPTTETILHKTSSVVEPEDMERSGDSKEEITNNEEIDCAAPVNVTPKSNYLSDPNKEQAEKGEEPTEETCATGLRSNEVSSSGIKEIASHDGQSEKEEKVNTETNIPEAPREIRIDEPIDASSPKDKEPFDEKNVPAVDQNEEDEIHQNDTAECQQDALPLVHETEASEGNQPSVEEPKIIHDIDEADRKHDGSDLGLPLAERALDMDLAPTCQIDAENLETESRLVTNNLNEEDEIHLYDTVQDAPPEVHETEASEGTQLHVEEPKVVHIIDEADRNLDSSDLGLPPTEGASDMDLAPPCQTDVDNLEIGSRLIENDQNEEDEIHLYGTAKGQQDAPPLVHEKEASGGTQLPVEEPEVMHNIDEADQQPNSSDQGLNTTEGESNMDLAPPRQIDADILENESRLVANDLNEKDESHLYETAKDPQDAPPLAHESETSEGTQLPVEEKKVVHNIDEADRKLDSSEIGLPTTTGASNIDLAPPHQIDADNHETESRLVGNDLNEEDEIHLYETAKDQKDAPQLVHEIEALEGSQLSLEQPKTMHDKDEADKRPDSSDLEQPATEGASDMDLVALCQIDADNLETESRLMVNDLNEEDKIQLHDPAKGQQDAPPLVYKIEPSEGTQEEPKVLMHNIDEADMKLNSKDLELPPNEEPSDMDLAPPCQLDVVNVETSSRSISNDQNEEDKISLYDTSKGQQDAPPLLHEIEASEGIQPSVEEPNVIHNIDEADRKLDSSDLRLPPTEGASDMDLAPPCQIDAASLETESKLIASDLNEEDEIQLHDTAKGQHDSPPLVHEIKVSEGTQLSVEEPKVMHNTDEADRKPDSSDLRLPPSEGASTTDLDPQCQIDADNLGTESTLIANDQNEEDKIDLQDTAKGQQDAPPLVHEIEASEGTQLSVEDPNSIHGIDEGDRKIGSSDLVLPQTDEVSDMDLTPPCQIDVNNFETESRLVATDFNEEDTIHLHDMDKGQQDAPPLVHEIEASEGTQLYVEEPKIMHDTDEADRQLDSSDLGLPVTGGASDINLAPPCQIDAENHENESNMDSKKELGIIETNTEDEVEQIADSLVESHHLSITNDANTKVTKEEREFDSSSTTLSDEKRDDLKVQESEPSNAPQMEEKYEATDLMDGKQNDMNDNINQNSKPEEHEETYTLDKQAEEFNPDISNKDHTTLSYSAILTTEESQEIKDKTATGCDDTDFTSPTDGGNIDELPSEGKALSEKLLSSSSELNKDRETESGTEYISESLEGKEIQGQILENSDGKETEGHASEISKGKETEGYELKSSEGKETQDSHVEKDESNSTPETLTITEEILGEGCGGSNGGMASEETEIDIPAANSHQSPEVEVSELTGDNNMTKKELYVPSTSEDILANHEDIVSRAMEEEIINNEKIGSDAPVYMTLKSDHIRDPYKKDIEKDEEMSVTPTEETCFTNLGSEADVASLGTKGVALIDEQSEKEEKAITSEINFPKVPTEAGKDENIDACKTQENQPFDEKNISADYLKEEDGTNQYDTTKDQPGAPPLIPETEVCEENQISVGDPEKRHGVNEADTMSNSSDLGLTPVEGTSGVDMIPNYQIDADKSESKVDSPKELHIAESNTKGTDNETIKEETNFNSSFTVPTSKITDELNIQESENREDTQIEDKSEAKANLEGHGETDTSNKEDEEITNITDKEQIIQNYPEALTTEESKKTNEEAASEVVTEDESVASVREKDFLDSPATPEEVVKTSIEEDKENGSQIKEEHCDKTIKSTNVTDEAKLENFYGEDEGKEDNVVIREVYTNTEAETSELDSHNTVLPTSSVETVEDISQVESEEDPAQPKEVSTVYTRAEAGTDKSDSSNTAVPALVATFEEINHQYQDLTKPKEVCISDEQEKIELDSLNTELPTSRVEAVDEIIHQENEDTTKPKEVCTANTHEEAETNEFDSLNNLPPTSIVEAVGENQEIIEENEDSMKPNEVIILEKESNKHNLDETHHVEETKAETLNSKEESTASSTIPSPTGIVENEMPREEHKSIEEKYPSLPDEPESKEEYSSTRQSAVTAITKEMKKNDCEESKMHDRDEEQDSLIFKDSASEPTGSKPDEASKTDESYNEMSSISESDVNEHDDIDRAYLDEQVSRTNASCEELPTISMTDIEEHSDSSNLETHVSHGSVERMEDQGTKSVENQIGETPCEYVEVMHENVANELSQVNEHVEKNDNIIRTLDDIKEEDILKELHSVSEADIPSHEMKDIGLVSMQSIDTIDSNNKAKEIPVLLAENPKTEDDASVIEAPEEMSEGKEDMKSIPLQNNEKNDSDEKSEESVLQLADNSNTEQESSSTEVAQETTGVEEHVQNVSIMSLQSIDTMNLDEKTEDRVLQLAENSNAEQETSKTEVPKETTGDKEHIKDMTNILFEKPEETSSQNFMKEADDCNDNADALVEKESSLEDVHIDEKTFQVEIKQLEETSGSVYQTEPSEIKEIISERIKMETPNEQEDNTDESQQDLKCIEEISGINHGSNDSHITSIQKNAKATNELQETREEQELETLDSITKTIHKDEIEEAGAEMSSQDHNCLTSESSRKDVDNLSMPNVTAIIDELQESKEATDLKSDMSPGVLESEAKLYNAEAPSETEKAEIKEDTPQAEIGAQNIPNEEMTETGSIEDSISTKKVKDEGSSGLEREAIPAEPQSITIEETSGTSNKENNEKVSSCDIDIIQSEKERGDDEYEKSFQSNSQGGKRSITDEFPVTDIPGSNEVGESTELVAIIHDETNVENEDQANTGDVKVNEVTEQDSTTEGDHSKIQDPGLENLKKDCIATTEVQMIDKPVHPLPEVSITNVLKDIEMMPESLKTTAQAETQKQQEVNDSNVVSEATHLDPELKFTIDESKTIEQDITTITPTNDPTLDLTQLPTVTNLSDGVEGESLAQLSEVHHDHVIKDVAEKEDPLEHESSNNKKVEIKNSGNLAVSSDKDSEERDPGESKPVMSSKHEDIPLLESRSAAVIDPEEVKQVYPCEAVPEPHSTGSAEKGASHDHEETPDSSTAASDLGHGFTEEDIPEPRDTDSQDQHAGSHVIQHVQESPMRSQEGSVDDVESTHQTAELKLPTIPSSESLSTPEVDQLIVCSPMDIKDASQMQEKIEAEENKIMDEPEESTEKLLPAEISEESTWEKADHPSETSKLKTQPAGGEVKPEDAAIEKEEHSEQKEGNSGSEVVFIGEKNPDDDTNKIIATEVKDMSFTTASNDMTSVQVDPEERTETLISREVIEVKADEATVRENESGVEKENKTGCEVPIMGEKSPDNDTGNKIINAEMDCSSNMQMSEKILSGHSEDHMETVIFSKDKEVKTGETKVEREEQNVLKGNEPVSEALPMSEKDVDGHTVNESIVAEMKDGTSSATPDDQILVQGYPKDHSEKKIFSEDKETNTDQDETVEEQHIPKEGNPEAKVPVTGEKDPDVQKEEKLESEVAAICEKDSVDNRVSMKENSEEFRETVTDREEKGVKSDSKSGVTDAEIEKLMPVNISEAVAESERSESAEENISSHDLNAEKIESPTSENLHALPHNTGLSTERIMKVDDSDIDISWKNQEKKEILPLATEKQMVVEAELKVTHEPEKEILQLQQKEAAEINQADEKSSGFGELGSESANRNNEKTTSNETKEGINLPSEKETPVVEHYFSIEHLSEAKKEEVHAKNTGRKEDSKPVKIPEHKDEQVKDEKEHQEENTRDAEVKVSPKKSHNILSGVISKMKKAITCTNSQPMPQSPR